MQKVFSKKLWKVMKLCAVQGMIATIMCGVTIANDNYGQVLEKPVTISIASIPFEQALGVIEDAADVKFHYSLEQIRNESEVSINAVQQPLRVILDDLLVARNFSYKVNEREGSISIKKQGAGNSSQSSLESSAVNSNFLASITGVVVESASGQPMAGVNVLIKGTTIGTTTDSQGRFSIEASETDVLVFSFIGYASQEIQLNDQRSIDVVMVEDLQSLEEVIINAGYWQVDKREGTGNISRVTSKDIEKQPVANPLQSLQGRMPGVVITQNTGITGGSMNVRIRGQNSLRSDGNYPLYVVDGVPVDSRPIESFSSVLSRGFDPLNTINPANIESIEILKDADATSIYGSRGANGVVLITTKKGKSGKTDLDISYYQGAGAVTNRLQLLNTEEYLMMREEAFANDNAAPGNADSDLNGKWTKDRYTDWQELLFGGTANIQDIQSAVSGGTETTSFRLGGSFHRETTAFQGDFGYKRVTGNMNVNHASRDQRLNISVSLNYGFDKNNLFNRNPVFDALTLPPTAPTYDENGDLIWSGYSINQKNPLSHLRVSHDTENRNFISNATVSYEIFKGVRIKSNFGFTDANTDEQIKVPKSSMDPTASVDSQTSFGKRNASAWIVEPQVTYEKEWRDHRLDVLIGTTWQSNTNKIQWIQATGFLSDGLLGNINAASSITSSRADDVLYRYNALFGRVGYQWKEKYIVNLTARRDGSSRFGPNRQFANFGAIGLAWIFSNEPFVTNSFSPLSFGKIRSSYGTSGSDQIGDYGYIGTYATSAFTYQGSKTLIPSALENEDYAWEVNRKFEIAMDLGFFDDRIALSTSFYSNRSSNQLVGYQLPVITGFPSVLGNLAATVENSGWEFELRTVNVKARDFSWNMALNLTVPKNKLVSYPGIESSTYANTYVVGEPLTIKKVYQYTGINPETGFYMFTDVDGNGSYSTADRKTVVNFGRNFYGGIENSLQYKGLTFDFFFEYVNQQSQGYYSYFPNAPGQMSNQPQVVLDRWEQPNDASEIQRFTRATSSSYQRLLDSDHNLEESSFLRLKTVAIMYSLPAAFVTKAKLKIASFFIRGQNLLTITSYRGLDPENGGSIQLPQLMTVTAGINIKL